MPVAVSGVKRIHLIPPYSVNSSRHIKAYERIPIQHIDDKYYISGDKIIVERYIDEE